MPKTNYWGSKHSISVSKIGEKRVEIEAIKHQLQFETSSFKIIVGSYFFHLLKARFRDH